MSRKGIRPGRRAQEAPTRGPLARQKRRAAASRLAHLDALSLHLEDLLELLVASAEEDRILEVVDPFVEHARLKETVD
jgi:hypothetical protein